jgi:hypothetical protein
MLGVARYHTIPLPTGRPRRVRSFGITDELVGMDSHARCLANISFFVFQGANQVLPRCRTVEFCLGSHSVGIDLGPLDAV